MDRLKLRFKYLNAIYCIRVKRKLVGEGIFSSLFVNYKSPVTQSLRNYTNLLCNKPNVLDVAMDMAVTRARFGDLRHICGAFQSAVNLCAGHTLGEYRHMVQQEGKSCFFLSSERANDVSSTVGL